MLEVEGMVVERLEGESVRGAFSWDMFRSFGCSEFLEGSWRGPRKLRFCYEEMRRQMSEEQRKR